MIVSRYHSRLQGDSDTVQIGCIYKEANWISNPDSDHLSHVDCDPYSRPGARVNAPISNRFNIDAFVMNDSKQSIINFAVSSLLWSV